MKNFVGIFFTTALMLCVCEGAFAADYKWTGKGTVSKWTDTANWSPSTGYPKGGDRAIFAATPATVTITADFDLGAGTLTLTNDVANTLTFDCVISGDGAIHKAGGGQLHLKKANTFKGGFTQLGIYPCDWKSASPYPTGYSSRVDTYIYDGKAFGTGKVVLDNDGKSHGSRLVIKASMTIANDVQLSADGSSYGNVWYDGGANQVVRWTGKVSSPMRYWCSTGSASGRKVYFDGEAIFPGWTSWNTTIEHFFNGHAELSTGGTLSPGAGCKFHFNSSGNLCQVLSCTCDFYFGAENALDNGSNKFTLNFSKNGWFHLDGNEQTFCNLAAMPPPSGVTGGYGFESPADKPAVLALTNQVPKTLEFSGDFTGAAGLWYAPAAGSSTFTISKKIQDTTGTMRVGGEGNVLKFASGSGFSSLTTLQADGGGTLMLAYDAKDSFAQTVVVSDGTAAWGGKLNIAYGRTLSCIHCQVGATDLAPGTYDKNTPGCNWLIGEGRLVVVDMNTWLGITDDWSASYNWSMGHVPSVGESAKIANGMRAVITNGTAALSRLEIASGSSLVFNNWNACVTADVIHVEGTITGTGPFTTGPTAPKHRVHLRCTDLNITSTGSINMNTNGWAGGTSSHPEGYGPGRSYNRGQKGGASHGGYGSIPLVYSGAMGKLYDDPMAPTLPGSGAVYGASAQYNIGTAGGGAILIEADGAVTVDGSILACGGDGVRSYTTQFEYCGSGGSIWIKCARLTGNGGVIRADGGNGVVAYNSGHRVALYQLGDDLALSGNYTSGAGSCGGGGMIRIEYSVAQQTASLANMTISAAGGIHAGRVLADKSVIGALTAATEDKYRTEADLGTLTFTDDTLVRQMLGKGLSGRLYGVTDFTWDGDLEWERGHIRFPGTEEAGANVTFNGNLDILSADSRLEIGGYESRTNVGVFVDRYAGTHLNQLTVTGNLRLLHGAALDIRAAETNWYSEAMLWGGLVTVSNDFYVGEDSWLYPWCDIKTLAASHFEIGGDFTVASNATVMADRRGGMGGRGGGSTTSAATAAWWFKVLSESGWGPGGGQGAAGGSHGGRGGVGFAKDVDAAKQELVGTAVAPLDDEWTADFPGSGGGNAGYGEGGEGGGLVHVRALGLVTIDGLITANGWVSTYATTLGNTTSKLDLYNRMGGGSGGGISLAGAAIEGSGTLRARGGAGYSGSYTGTSTLAGHELQYSGSGGGGGRIVLAAGANLRSSPNARWQVVTNLSDNVMVQARVRFTGTADAAKGGVLWGGSDWETKFKKTPAAPEFEGLSCGEAGTVRYKRFFTPGFIFSIEYPEEP